MSMCIYVSSGCGGRCTRWPTRNDVYCYEHAKLLMMNNPLNKIYSPPVSLPFIPTQFNESQNALLTSLLRIR